MIFSEKPVPTFRYHALTGQWLFVDRFTFFVRNEEVFMRAAIPTLPQFASHDFRLSNGRCIVWKILAVLVVRAGAA